MVRIMSSSYTREDFQYLLETLSAGVECNPCHETQCNRCAKRHACGDLTRAIEWLDRAIESYPDLPKAK